MTDFERLLQALVEGGVEFIVIGGIAANAHGAIRTTRDLDVVYRRTSDNLNRLERTLSPLEPYLRDAPPGLPFRFDAATLAAGLNFTLSTSLGALDLFGDVAGGGDYDALVANARPLNLFGVACPCLDLDTLIRVKRAAGRPKDFEVIAELEALREEQRRRD